MTKKHYRSIFISDCHLGFKHSSPQKLNKFLKSIKCDNLYLVGDIIDFWELERKVVWSHENTEVLRQIMQMKRNNGTNIYYIIGNHDGILRKYLNDISFEGVSFSNEITHTGVDGKTYLVVHGDLFDHAAPVWTVISKIGGHAYSASIVLNGWINCMRRLVGREPWSLSAYLKGTVKRAVQYINQFEKHMVEYCKDRKYDGAICGHIHHAGIKEMGEGLIYMNCGDWVESCTALVEHEDGRFEIIC
jgi:UDP-2,3-diacylglucosamine pyrophosphatase LpxH